jgi:hypothetical protein
MPAHCRHALVLVPSLLVLAALPAQAQFTELAARVPSSANAITLVNGERLMNSPIAIREGWKDKYSTAFAAGLHSIPPDTKQFVLAADVNYEFMQPSWRVAVAETLKPRAMSSLARLAHGTVDSIADKPALALRDNSYLIALSDTRFAIMAPANRQAVSRWLRETDARMMPVLSRYLQSTLVAAETSEMVVAFDLEDAIPADVISGKLSTSSALAGKKIDLAAAAKALASIRGVAVELSVKEEVIGRILIHFNGDATILGPVAKDLLLEVMGDLGAHIEDIESWEVKVEPNRISLQGPLSAEGLKKFFSLIEQPTSALIATDNKPATTQPQPDPVAYASQQYFTAINSILEDARRESSRAKTFGQSAMWFDGYARRIDRLSVLSVDPQLVAFGTAVAASFRDVSASLRGIGINSASRTAQVFQQTSTSVNVSGAPGYWGWGGGMSYYTEWRNVDGERRAIRAQERATGATNARSIIQQIQNEASKIRAAMSQKYQVNF